MGLLSEAACSLYSGKWAQRNFIYWGYLATGSAYWQHKNNLAPGFTQKHRVHDLVYFELCDDMFTAITGEKQIIAGSRDKKIALIESVNPEWRDLYGEVV